MNGKRKPTNLNICNVNPRPPGEKQLLAGFKEGAPRYTLALALPAFCTMILKAFILIVCILTYATSATAEIYKWTDENGNVIYGDKPVSKKVTEKIKIREKSKQQLPQTPNRFGKQEKLLDIMQQERNEKLMQAKKEKIEKEERKQKCVAARKHLQKMKYARFIYEKTDDPLNPIILSDEERKAEQDRLAENINKYCQ